MADQGTSKDGDEFDEVTFCGGEVAIPGIAGVERAGHRVAVELAVDALRIIMKEIVDGEVRDEGESFVQIHELVREMDVFGLYDL